MAEQDHLVPLTVEVVSSYVGQNNIRPDDVPALIASIHDALKKLQVPETPAESEAPAPSEFTPAVTARKSLASPDHIISMIDGKPYKTLRRHLSANGLTPEQYRERYNLKPDYPMVAPSYSDARKAMAKAIGLGRKARNTVIDAVESVAETVVETVAPKRGRKPKAPSNASA
jgi:predicted transcriptional regulator